MSFPITYHACLKTGYLSIFSGLSWFITMAGCPLKLLFHRYPHVQCGISSLSLRPRSHPKRWEAGASRSAAGGLGWPGQREYGWFTFITNHNYNQLTSFIYNDTILYIYI